MDGVLENLKIFIAGSEFVPVDGDIEYGAISAFRFGNKECLVSHSSKLFMGPW